MALHTSLQPPGLRRKPRNVFIPAPRQRKFWLLGTAVTYLSRRFARTLADRTFVHQPNAIKGNKPITIGHDYSVLSYLPEKAAAQSPPWIVPLIVRRVSSTETAADSPKNCLTVPLSKSCYLSGNDQVS